MKFNRVLLTGATGFVGRETIARLTAADIPVVCAVRRPSGFPAEVTGIEIGGQTDWTRALEGCDAIIHVAGQTPGKGVDEAKLHEVNVAGTARLVAQAAELRIGTVIFISSIFAVVDGISPTIVTDQSIPTAKRAYGRTKLAAESHVQKFAEGSGRTGISLRPPLVHGANALGNWRLLQKLAASSLPLPFGAVTNRRTMISVANLADAIVQCLVQARPGDSGTYAVADAETLSLSEILRLLRQGMGKSSRLLPVPSVLLRSLLSVAGQSKIADSLFGDLEIDCRRFNDAFSWRQPQRAERAILESAASFIDRNRRS